MSWLPALVCALLVGDSLGRFVQLVERPQVSELDQAQPVKYVITGQKDRDGRWTEQVKMEHGEDDWHIEVDHMTLEVGEGQPKVKITATFSAKSKTHDVAVVPDEDSSEEVDSDRGGAVFQLFPRSHLDWFGANRQCKDWGGHLAIPDSSAKIRELTRILRKHVEDIGESTGAFLGFDDLKREGHFVTLLGKPLFDSRDSTWSPRWFQAGQPDNDMSWTKDGEDCGSMRPNGGLNDVPCRYNLPFLCEKAARVETVAVAEKAVDEEEGTSDVVAASDSENDEDSQLELFLHHLDWYKARTACIEWGGQLAIPNTGLKMLKMKEILKSAMESSEDASAFVGYNEIWKKGQSFTLGRKGDPVPSASVSSSKQPQDDDEEEEDWTIQSDDCGVLPVGGGLSSVPCLHRLPYFCEKSSGVVTSEDLPEQTGDNEQLVSHEVDTLTLIESHDFDWFEGNDACRELLGGHLAIPDSAEKMEAMTAKMKLANVPAAFLGFSDQEKEGHFVTIFGKPVFTESSSWSPHWWREDQPDDDKSWFDDGEDCGSVKVGGGLNDVPCRHHMPFFCETPSPDVDQASKEDAQHTSHEATPDDDDDHIDAASSEVPTSSEKQKIVHTINIIKDLEDLQHKIEAQISAQSNAENESSEEDAISQVIHE